MKIAVINFSGNVGKSTIARHLLLPRIAGAEHIVVESLNAEDSQTKALRGRQFGALQEYLQVVGSTVVDIGASNVEELMALMRKYSGSHEDFDCFVVPTVPTLKQQQDTIATLADLAQVGVCAERIKLLFNMVEDDVPIPQAFETLLAFNRMRRFATANLDCRLGANEIYQRIKGSDADISALAADPTDYKALIAQASDSHEKLRLAQRLATRRLAIGVVPELDACFAALGIDGTAAPTGRSPQRKPA